MLSQPAVFDVSVQWIVEGWVQDVVRGIEALRRFEGTRSVQHVVACITSAGPDTMPEDVEFLSARRNRIRRGAKRGSPACAGANGPAR